MLFSEPKISQIWLPLSRTCPRLRFSALQRAENFSNIRELPARECANDVSVLFSEPKISQIQIRSRQSLSTYSFSALQRAENFSNFFISMKCCDSAAFQCSSASRKFLKRELPQRPRENDEFQCSSASRKFLKGCLARVDHPLSGVSVLFSEPKISQTN